MEFYATLGAACQKRETLEQMFRAGMTGIRLNLSHTSLGQCRPLLESRFFPAARAAGVAPQLMIDLQGPELRVGQLPYPIDLREGKDALLSSVSFLFDQKYEELMETMDPDMDCFDQLMYLNRELFAMIENSISLDLLARLYSSQLITRGDKHLLDHNRTYYKLLRQIVLQGQQRGQLRGDVTVSEMVRVYALCERALIYDWCLSGGGYSLRQYGQTMMPMFFQGFRPER